MKAFFWRKSRKNRKGPSIPSEYEAEEAPSGLREEKRSRDASKTVERPSAAPSVVHDTVKRLPVSIGDNEEEDVVVIDMPKDSNLVEHCEGHNDQHHPYEIPVSFTEPVAMSGSLGQFGGAGVVGQQQQQPDEIPDSITEPVPVAPSPSISPPNSPGGSLPSWHSFLASLSSLSGKEQQAKEELASSPDAVPSTTNGPSSSLQNLMASLNSFSQKEQTKSQKQANNNTSSTAVAVPEESTATDYVAFEDDVSDEIPSKGPKTFGLWSWFGAKTSGKTDRIADSDDYEPDRLMKARREDDNSSIDAAPSRGAGGDSVTTKGLWSWFGGARPSDHTDRTVENDAREPDALMKDDEPTTSAPSRRIRAIFCSSAFIYATIFFIMAAGLAYGAVKQYGLFNSIDWDEQISVAFAGSSYLFVNDIPRVMEVISEGQVTQDSCLHSGGSLASLLMTGNGMYYRWQTSAAQISNDYNNDYDENDENDGYSYVNDYGACSVHQLILGYDQYIAYENDNNAYYDDGNNPCIMDETYLEYATYKYLNNPPNWDYVVLADQSKRVASYDARYDTVDALVSVYAPLLAESGAVPAIVDTHAFWASNTNMTRMEDIPTFTALIYEGVEQYAEALAAELSTEQEPIIVPIGLAYLTIWEENYDFWTKLFISDEMHASLLGSYLFATVLYTKLFGHLPKKNTDHVESLFSNSRKLFGSANYPTAEEAQYLRNVAKRVVLNGYTPKSFSLSE